MKEQSGLAYAGGSLLGPKSWADCTDAEKIERLKDQLSVWIRVCNEQRQRIDTLESHQHDTKGDVVISLRDQRYRSAQCEGSWNPLA